MTIRNTSITETKSTITLQLTGSQINLSPRPIPITHHVIWSSHCRTYPMRRSVSAFGFQQSDEMHSNVTSRPLSADNIRSNKNRFNDDFHDEDDDEDVHISSTSQVFNETCQMSDNIFENIINGYSENKFFTTQPVEPRIGESGNLKPGLSSKPPLPPFVGEPKTNLNSHGTGEEEHSKTKESNIKSMAEQEAFDEIIDLKFQQWFSDASTRMRNQRDTENDVNDLRMLSYEQQFQSCEFRGEIRKKTKKILSFDKNTTKWSKNHPASIKTARQKYKKLNDKIRKKSADKAELKGPVWTDDVRAENAVTENKNESEYADVPYPATENRFEYKEQSANLAHDVQTSDDILQMLEERDLRMLREKQNSKITTKIDDKGKSKNIAEKLPSSATNDAKPKCTKPTHPNKSNSMSPTTSPFKKQKKISFSLERRNCLTKSTKRGSVEEMSSYETRDDNGLQIEERNSTTAEGLPDGTTGHVPREDAISPQQAAGPQIDDIPSWMDTHHSATPRNKTTSPEAERNNSMYAEIVDILNDIEKDEIQDSSKNFDVVSKERTTSPAKAIWSLLEEAEKNIDVPNINKATVENHHRNSAPQNSSKSSNAEENKNWNRLSDLLRYSTAELAQKVMALQLLLEERETTLQNLHSHCKSGEQKYQQQKQESEYAINKRQRLIEQLQHDKKATVEKFETMLKEMERKHTTAVQLLEEKNKIELEKYAEKRAAAEKFERDRWKEVETKKIQERAIKGFQPELNRMTSAHEEEITELHKCYKKQLEDLEETHNRRMAVQKEKYEADKEKALAIEREIWRQKLEDEIGELEKRYQDQRKRLLAEVHVERENMERANEATLAIKEKENERKWQEKSLDMQKKIEALQMQHQEEIQKLHQNVEGEKQIWINNQTREFMEKENRIKEQCKKDRDKHIELIIQKLEGENTEKELAGEQKIKRLKEQYEAEINDVETANENLRRKLNESRGEIQKYEELISQLRAQLNQSQTECLILKEKYDRLVQDQGEIQNMAKSELSTRNHILQSELNQAQLTFESQLKLQQREHERELSQMYNKFREIVLRKDEAIDSLRKQKETALLQCNQLEKLLDMKRMGTSGSFTQK